MDEFNPVLQKFILLLNGFDSLNADENSIDLELCFDDGLDINIHAVSAVRKVLRMRFEPAKC